MLALTHCSAATMSMQAVVPCRAARLFGQVGRGQKSEDAEPVVDGDQHHALEGQKVAVVARLELAPPE